MFLFEYLFRVFGSICFFHGRKGNYDVALAEKFGKNAATVLALLCFLPESLKYLAFHLSTNNRFTAFQFTIFEAQRNWI